MNWAADALTVLAAGEPAALVTILAVEGSAPRTAGTRMVVTAHGAQGTIGGGNLEFRAVEQARRILGQSVGTWRIQDYPLGPLLGQCCGGRVRLQVERLGPADRNWLAEARRLGDGRVPFAIRHRFGAGGVERTVSVNSEASVPGRERPGPGDAIVERFDPRRLRLVMVGAGHVGSAVAHVLAGTPIVLDWLDTRPGFTVGGAALVSAAEAARRIEEAAEDDAVLVVTHDHGLDYALVAAALRGHAGFVGLIGSATKRARFLARLRRDGLQAAAMRLVCPIGVPGIAGKEPAVIAIAVAAQLLAFRGASR